MRVNGKGTGRSAAALLAAGLVWAAALHAGAGQAAEPMEVGVLHSVDAERRTAIVSDAAFAIAEGARIQDMRGGSPLTLDLSALQRAARAQPPVLFRVASSPGPVPTIVELRLIGREEARRRLQEQR